MTVPARNPAVRSLDFPLLAIIGIIIRGRGEKKPTHNNYKAKLERLHLARLTHHDQEVRLLGMKRLQVIETHKPTTVIF
jgi:hypothetical protein